MSLYRHAQVALVALVALIAGLASGCDDGVRRAPVASDPAPPAARPVPAAPPPTRWFHVTLTSPHAEVPFFLGLDGAPGAERAIFVNGAERIEADVERKGAAIRVVFPVFNTSLDLVEQGDRLVGKRISPYSKDVEQKVVAVPIAAPDPMLRFPDDPAGAAKPTTDFSGSWRAEFAGRGPGKGIFEQDARGVVTGTFVMRKFGDVRFLAGRVDGDRLRVSTYDGQHAYTFVATAGPKPGEMKGEWFDAEGYWSDRFEAVRDDASTIEMFDAKRVKRTRGRLTLPLLDQPPFKGKPVIVDLFGTWCPACVDATPFLVELYRDNHPRGLEIVSLAYELASPEENRVEVGHFVEKFGVKWPIEIHDVSIDAFTDGFAGLLPPELEGMEVWPTAVFLDASHKVLAIHVGFVGPAAGPDHVRLTTAWRALVEKMIASQPAAPTPAAPAP